MKRTAIVLLCLLGLRAWAQPDLGIRNSNYAGIQGSLINPGSIAGSKIDWDVGFSINVDFANTFLYAPQGPLPFFGIRRIIKGSIDENLWKTRYDPSDPNKLYNVAFSAEFLGPSFFMKIKKKHEIGLTTAVRGMANIRDITGNAAQNAFDYLLSGSLWNTTFQEQSARLNGMGWIEYGLHYATVLKDDGRDQWKAGITLKYEQGMFAVYAKNTHLTYKITDTTGILFTNSSIDYGRTAFDDFRHISYPHFDHGHGFGADLGVIFVHRDHAGDDGYRYRIGLSLLDVGKIDFTRNTASYHLAAASADFSNWHQAQFTGNTQLDQTLSAVFYNGDSARSRTGTSFHMALPAALSIQADYAICGPWFADVTIMKGFGHGDNVGVVQPDLYSVTPRYETRQFEASLPLSLMYYGRLQPRVGLAVRVWYFFIGGDAPGALFKLNDLRQADFYIGIHYFK
ncbi:MAG TPA: DUF5723 family protein [Puia sp.]|jgi:hypothetical protein|nr:DUF5723 family protein [Puia sp.]